METDLDNSLLGNNEEGDNTKKKGKKKNKLARKPRKKRRKTYVSFSKFLDNTTTALTNGLLPETLPTFIKMGISEAEINDKLLETKALNDLYAAQKLAKGIQNQATKDYKTLATACNETYIEQIEIARIVFEKDIAAKVTLGLKGARKSAAPAYIAQALLFYKGGLGNVDYGNLLAKRGISQADLAAGKANYEQLSGKWEWQQQTKGAALAATKTLKEARKLLHNWMVTYKKLAVIAFKKRKGVLTMLGY